ncbi:MAG TPA: hypothetical protein ENF33_00955 [Nitrososphaeria archaeon]|nr:hypothetical protein [Nitrososphaeria archaeon]
MSLEMVETGCRVIDKKVGGFKRGAIILVLGPPMGGKRNLCRNFIARGLQLGEGCIVSCTNTTAEQEHEEFKRILGPDADKFLSEGRLAYIDLFSAAIGLPLEEKQYIKRIPSASDLTSYNVALRELLLFMQRRRLEKRLLFDSVSTLLLYNPFQTVSRFLHILFGKLRAMKVTSLFLLEEEAHERSVVVTVMGMCNGILRIKSEDGRMLIRYESETARIDWTTCD